MWFLALLVSLTCGCGALALGGALLFALGVFQDTGYGGFIDFGFKFPFYVFWIGAILIGFILPWLLIH